MKLCPFCGAYSTRSCDFDEPDQCPWEDMDEDEDVDLLPDDVGENE